VRVVIDTNVWASALLTRGGAPARIRAAHLEGRFTPVTSVPMLAELADVIGRPRLIQRCGLTPEDRAELLRSMFQRAELVEVDGSLHLCRDPDDDVVIETAVRAQADALVSRDDDLKGDLELMRVLSDMGISVLSVRQFLARRDMA
jgi:putative PIN family toxin of toxin-antitoxin system